MNTKGKIGFGGMLGIVATFAWINTSQAALILEYKFNETGTSAASSGTDATPLTLQNSIGTATDFHGAAGSGVSGLPGDRAFDNTASAGMGSGFAGGRGFQPDNEAIEPLAAVTLQGWYKTDTAPGNFARLFSSGGGFGGLGIDLIFGYSTSNQVAVGINGNPGIYSPSGLFADLNEWIFIAATYTNGSLKIYKGSTNSAVAEVFSATPSFGPVANNTLGLAIGNHENLGSKNPFDGLLDNMRVYNEVLNQSQLEFIRQADVPEPSAALLLIAGGILAWKRRGNGRN